MEKIVVGINLTKQSSIVLKFALRLAQYHTAKLTVVRILDKQEVPVSKGADKATVQEVYRLEKETALNEFISPIKGKQFHSIPLTIVVRFGHRTEELCLVANEEVADLIVVGKLTKTGQLLFSDTADTLIDRAPCPLFIVPEDAVFHAFSRIVYAADFILEDCKSIFYLQTWLTVFKAELICLHVCKDETEEKKAKEKLAILNRLFPQENIKFEYVIGTVESGIHRYVRTNEADMIATIHRERHLWTDIFRSSLSKTLARDVLVPMMVFQEKKSL